MIEKTEGVIKKGNVGCQIQIEHKQNNKHHRENYKDGHPTKTQGVITAAPGG